MKKQPSALLGRGHVMTRTEIELKLYQLSDRVLRYATVKYYRAPSGSLRAEFFNVMMCHAMSLHYEIHRHIYDKRERPPEGTCE